MACQDCTHAVVMMLCFVAMAILTWAAEFTCQCRFLYSPIGIIEAAPQQRAKCLQVWSRPINPELREEEKECVNEVERHRALTDGKEGCEGGRDTKSWKIQRGSVKVVQRHTARGEWKEVCETDREIQSSERRRGSMKVADRQRTWREGGDGENGGETPNSERRRDNVLRPRFCHVYLSIVCLTLKLFWKNFIHLFSGALI